MTKSTATVREIAVKTVTAAKETLKNNTSQSCNRDRCNQQQEQQK
jgi:hypothetical protein